MIRLTRRESGAAGKSLAVVFSMPMGRSRPRSGYASLWERKAKPTFVLVHGAFHGGWCWERLTRYMLGAGYTCYCISLTGLGLMSNLAHPGIDLESHIEDVMTVIDSEDLRDVVLVGHAYGGMVIAGVADRMPSRIRRAVYLDAFVPDRGKCVMDYIQPAEKAAEIRKRGEVSGMIDPPSVYEWGLTRPADIRWATRFLSRQPYRTLTQPIALKMDAARASVRKTYIHCTAPATRTFSPFAARLRSDPSWQLVDFKGCHDSMIAEPERLARLFLRVA